MNKNFEPNCISNQKGTDKINSISENLTKIKVSFYFYWSVDFQDRKIRLSLCTCISEMNLGCTYWNRCAK